MTEHTPTPWNFTNTPNGLAACNDDGLKFVEIVVSDDDDAAFIVRAVNHHEALVAIVREMTALPSDDDVKDMIVFSDAHDCGRDLLAELDATP